MKNTLLIAALLAASLPALADRPLSTETAAILDDGMCQVESWVDRSRANTTEANFNPACVAFGTEFQFGNRWLHEDGKTRFSGQFVQAKYVAKNLDEGEWGIGFVGGLVRPKLRETKSDWGDPYFLVPFSFGIGADKESRWLVHLNIGTTHDRAEGRNLTLWGVAFEKPVSERFTVLGEVFGENASHPFYRAGGRYTAITEHLYLDLSYVGRSGGAKEDRLWSLGFHVEGDLFK